MIHSQSEITITSRDVVTGTLSLQVVVLALLIASTLGLSFPLLRPLVIVVYLTFTPGLLLVFLFEAEDRSLTTVIVYTVGLSLLTVMATGAVISLLYPVLGIARPLSVLPLGLTLCAIVFALIFGLYKKDDNWRDEISIPFGRFFSPTPLALSLLPFISIFGTVLLSVYDSNLVLLWMLILISVIPLIVALRGSRRWWYPFAIWTIALALLYHANLGPFHGGHPGAVMALEHGRWIPNITKGRGSLLPNSVLFPTYAILTGLSLPVEWGTVNPFLVSFLPVILYEMFRRQVSERTAFLATSVFMFSFPFYVLYPGGGRVATPVFFLALVGLTLSDSTLSEVPRTGMALVFAAGLAVSHYGTAYVAMFAFTVAGVVIVGLALIDRSDEITALRSTFKLTGLVQMDVFSKKQTTVIRPSHLAFYFVFVSTWYLHTAKGVKFAMLPRKIVDAVRGVLYLNATGSAANVVTKDYGSQIVAASRMLYILLGVLMALGLLVVSYKRVVHRDRVVGDEFLALALGFFFLLGGSALPSGTGFAIARVMMIIFTFTLPFAVIGLSSVFVLGRQVRLDSAESIRSTFTRIDSSTLFAIIITAFLLFNSGVVAEALQEDYAPSTRISQERLLESENPIVRLKATKCEKCNVQVHAWIINHDAPNSTVYGDRITQIQMDFYSGAITSNVGHNPGKAYYNTSIWMLQNGSLASRPNSYFVLLLHNLDTGGVYRTKYDWSRFGGLKQVFNRSHRIYTSGYGVIYRLPLNKSNLSHE